MVTDTLVQMRVAATPKLLRRLVDVKPEEVPSLLRAFACALSVFAGYSLLRPVREAMGVTSGVAALPSLFWASFALMLVMQPVYGWVLARFPRRTALPRLYGFLALTLVAFYAWFFLQTDHTWVARSYFVWVSVFNLFVVAVFWSLMAEIYRGEQAVRLFGFVAAGLSAGGLIGSALASELAPRLGSIQLLLFAAGLFVLAAWLMQGVLKHARPCATNDADGAVEQPLRSGAWHGFVQVARSSYLSGNALFVLLLTAVSTVLYLKQQQLVAASPLDANARTVLFARIDFVVQAVSLLGQLFIFPRVLKYFGFATAIASMPVLLLIGFTVIGFSADLNVVVWVFALRRIGEYSLTRPSRDLLMSVVSREEKYQAKSLIDTFVYRGGDALSASLVAVLASAAISSVSLGIGLCVVWSVVALWLGRRYRQLARPSLSTARVAAAAKNEVTSGQTIGGLSVAR